MKDGILRIYQEGIMIDEQNIKIKSIEKDEYGITIVTPLTTIYIIGTNFVAKIIERNK